MAIARILGRTKRKYESNALTRQAYLNNKKMFEPVNLDDLKKRYPNLRIVRLMVDTERAPFEDWYVIGMEKRSLDQTTHDSRLTYLLEMFRRKPNR